MPGTEWRLEGYNLTTCTCAWGCPCQFNALPTYGHCHAAVAIHVVRGHHGEVRLDGLSFGGLFAWPQAIHLGNGAAVPIVDERANAAQREAILKIMSGQDTEPGATFFQVFFSTLTTVHDPIFTRADFEFDKARRTGRVVFAGVGEITATPIRNPVTGAEHRAGITMPEGFEYTEAEVASSRVKTAPSAPIPLDWDGRHAHLADLRITGRGVVRA
jgi:hypothetical protein